MEKIVIEKIERETEKAVLVASELESAAGRRGVKVWWPKSQIRIDGHNLLAPSWLVRRKVEEITGRAGAAWFN